MLLNLDGKKKIHQIIRNRMSRLSLVPICKILLSPFRYQAYKCLLHNFTGRMDNMWLGKGANDPTERKRRLLNRMEGE